MRRLKRYGIAFIVLTIIITIFAAAIGSGDFKTCLMYGFFFSLFIIVAVWAVGAAIRPKRRQSGTRQKSHPVMRTLTAPTRISNNVANQVGRKIMGGGGSGTSRGDEAWQMNHDQALRNADACRNAGNYQGAKMWENEANK